MIYALPIVALALGLVVGAVLSRRRALALLAVLAALILVVFAVALWRGQQMPGWDGMGLSGVAWVLCLPLLVGLVVGGALGWRRRRRVTFR